MHTMNGNTKKYDRERERKREQMVYTKLSGEIITLYIMTQKWVTCRDTLP